MVMSIHAAENFYLGGEAPNVTFIASRGDAAWVALTESVCRVCVPLFVIASSYLLFPVSRPAGAFFKRRLARVVVPFLFWAAAYVLVAGGDLRQLAFNFPNEGGHLWFVPMLLGLYLAMPLLSPWAEKVGRRELSGWILLWLFTTSFPFLRRLWTGMYGAPPFGAVPYLYGECPWNSFGAFQYVGGFFGYVLIGLWFRKFYAPQGWARTLAIALPLWAAGAAIIGLPFYLYADAFPFSAPYSAAVDMEMSIEYCSLGVALATVAAFSVMRKIDFRGWGLQVSCPPDIRGQLRDVFDAHVHFAGRLRGLQQTSAHAALHIGDSRSDIRRFRSSLRAHKARIGQSDPRSVCDIVMV